MFPPSRRTSGFLAYAFGVQKGVAGALDASRLRALQLERLNATLAHARQASRYYRAQLPAQPLSTLEELAELPLMDASIFQSGYTSLLCVSQNEVDRIVTLPTSGTTGAPKRIAFTAADHATTLAYFTAGMRMLAQEGECIAVLYPCSTPGGLGRLLCESIEMMPAQALACGIPTSFQQLAETFQKENIRAAVGFPQHLFAFARWCEHFGVELELKAVLLSADNVVTTLSREIERVWNAQTFAHFGMTETGYGGAVECPLHNGYHLRETDLLFEVIDPETGTVVPDGQWGELVFTTLRHKAMPMIRYRTGDLTRILPGECPCGSILRRMDKVQGRVNERVTLKEGLSAKTFGMPELEEALFSVPGVIDFAADYFAREKLLQLKLQLLPGTDTRKTQVIAALKQAEPFADSLKNKALHLSTTIEHVSEFQPLYQGKRLLRRQNE